MFVYLKKERLLKFFDYFVLFSSVVLIVALSFEILTTTHKEFSNWFVNLQLVICSVFLLDFFIAMSYSRNRFRYFWSHILVFIVSLPYLSIQHFVSMTLEQEGVVLIAIMPILRAFVALYILLRWLVRGESALRLLYAYLLSVISFTYISALLFYECEWGTNAGIADFWDAIWWASMALTTTELTITPVTVTAKVLAVALPLAGMLMLPVATNYLFSMRSRS